MPTVALVIGFYSLLLLTLILLLMLLIARFFERKSGLQSGYRGFVLAGLFLIAGGVASLDPFDSPVAHLIGDGCLLCGGLILIWFSHRLFVIMTGGRR